MNTLKKFSVETHKGWASFQKWIKKWNKIMAVIFSALVIILLLSTVIVNALSGHEEAQKYLPKIKNVLNGKQVCQWDQINSCRIYCNSGISTALSHELNILWITNYVCHSEGISIEIRSSVHFPKFTIHSDWLKGDFKINELQIDLENIFVIHENAFAADVFDSVNKLSLINIHLNTMDVEIIQKLFINHRYIHWTITKKLYSEQLLNGTMTHMYYDSIFYTEASAKYQDCNQANLEDMTLFANINPLIICLTIVGCIISFALGFLIKSNLFEQKKISNNNNKINRMVFVVDKDVFYINKYYSKQKENSQNQNIAGTTSNT